MKKIQTVFTLLLLLTAANTFSQGFTSVFSKDGTNVIAVGGNTIFRSADGGLTWGSTVVTGSLFYSVSAFGSNVWISDQSNNSVYTSTDNGSSWTSYTVAAATAIYGICFTNANTGWVAGSNGIYKTTNGGVNWSTGLSSFRDTYVSVKFTNALKGVACSQSGRIIYTSNGGSNWSVASNPAAGKELHSIDIKDNSAIATGADAFILISTNSGATWSYKDYNILTRSDVKGINIIDNNTFYTCGGGGFIRKTTDGGASFIYQVNPMMADLSSIYFFDANKGWAVSSLTRAILSTTNGGLNWSLPASASVNFNWVRNLSAGGNIGNTLYRHPGNKNAMFVVCGAVVYRSPDLGKSWTQIATITLGSPAHSFYVNPNDTNMFIASIGSGGGRVVKSTDYGVTWTSVWGPGSLTSYGMPLEMDPNHPDTMYLSPSNSPVLRSTDFGSTWTNWSSMTFGDMCDMISMYKNSNILYLADQIGGGKFYKSTDYGVNWTMLFSPGGAEIPMIGVSNLDTNRIFFTNWGGTGFWRSTNNGVNWAVANSTSGAWGADVAKDDPMVAVHGTYGGSIYITTNGGDNFITTVPGDQTNYGLYFYDRGNLVAQQSGGIFRLTVSYDVPLAVNQVSGQIPKSYRLAQNYPNPFNPSTTIKYSVPKESFVRIKIYDILGKLVDTPVDQNLNAGLYELKYDASKLSSGIYFYKIEAGGFTDMKKMILVK